MPEEIWVDVQGYENIYRVSNLGRVMSCARVIPDGRSDFGTRTKQERLLRLTVDAAGYQKVTLLDKPRKEVWKVHRLVAAHFCVKPEGCDVVNHIDNCKVNNHASNLEWTTPLGNNQHMVAQGRQRPPKGELSGTAKVKTKDIPAIREKCAQGVPQKEVGQMYGLSQAHVSRIVRGTRWAHV